MARIGRIALLSIVTVATISVVGCSGSGTVSGSLYGVTVGGDAKRGVDVEVVLVRRTPDIQQRLATLEADFARALEPAEAAYKEAGQRAAAASQHASTSSYQDLSIEAAAARGASRRSADAQSEAASAVAAVRHEYRAKARSLLLQAKVQSTRTDANGHFEFKDVKAGQHYLFAEWAVQRIQYSSVLGSYPVTDHMDWLVPVELTTGPNRIDLSTSNSGWALSWGR